MTNREFLNRLSDEGMAIFIDTLSDAEHEPCQYCCVIRQDKFGIYLGCNHEPYKGKWIAELDVCPKDIVKISYCCL